MFQNFAHQKGFQPGDYHVIIGRGKKSLDHAGNVRFRCLIESKLQEYSEAKSKAEKSMILASSIQAIRDGDCSTTGGFVKFNRSSGRWVEVGDFHAREKTSQAFRDVLHHSYRSSKESKKKRRYVDIDINDKPDKRFKMEDDILIDQMEHEDIYDSDQEVFNRLSSSLCSIIDENDMDPLEPNPIMEGLVTLQLEDGFLKEEKLNNEYYDIFNHVPSESSFNLKILSARQAGKRQKLASICPTLNMKVAISA